MTADKKFFSSESLWLFSPECWKCNLNSQISWFNLSTSNLCTRPCLPQPHLITS